MTRPISGSDLRILVPGGYGVFGKLLVRELLETTDAHVVIAGRDVERAGGRVGRSGRPTGRRRSGSTCRTSGASRRPRPPASRSPAPRDRSRRSPASFRSPPSASELTGSTSPTIPAGCCRSSTTRRSTVRPRGRGRRRSRGCRRCPRSPGSLAASPASGSLPPSAPESSSSSGTAIGRAPARRRARSSPGSTIPRRWNSRSDGAGPTGSRPRTWISSGRDLGIRAEFRVALEWGYLGWLTAALGRATRPLGTARQARLSRTLSRISRPLSLLGTRAGCVQVDIWSATGSVSVAAVAGQPIVVLPCALAVRALLGGEMAAPGVGHPAAWLPADRYLARLRDRGVRFLLRSSATGRST